MRVTTDEFSLEILADSELYEILPPSEKKAKSRWKTPEENAQSSRKLLIKVNHLGAEEVEDSDEGTKTRHTIVLYVAIMQSPEFVEIEVTLKRGERIVYEGKEYTIRTTQKKPFTRSSFIKAEACYED